jgi:F-type H+-transporting ATPase subunit b
MTMHVLAASSDNFGLSFLLELIALVPVIMAVRHVWQKGVGNFLPSIRDSIARRRELISEELAAGERARAHSAELVAAAKNALEDAKIEAEHIVDQARRAAAALVAEGESAAEQEYARAISRAEDEISASRNRLRAELTAETGEIVVAAAERVVQAVLDDDRHHRLIGEAISATEAESA